MLYSSFPPCQRNLYSFSDIITLNSIVCKKNTGGTRILNLLLLSINYICPGEVGKCGVKYYGSSKSYTTSCQRDIKFYIVNYYIKQDISLAGSSR
jgi:hypothetical protein